LGVWFKKSSRSREALPMADGPVSSANGEPKLPDDFEQRRPAALEAGMPADRSSDADIVRPGFADYARGA
jgi:hypothetical protein